VNGSTVRIGIVGYGNWGPNLARVFSAVSGCTVAAICDSNRERLHAASHQHPAAELTTSYDALVDDPSIDSIVIAVPARSHFAIAIAALQRGKHVLVEKPITRSVDEAARLIDEATRRNLVLLVDHTFLFSPAVRKLREIIAGGILGDIHYFHSVRANLGVFREDVNVFWDVALHDITILGHILNEKPMALEAVGVRHTEGGLASMGYLKVFFDSGAIADITASWLSPRKIRRILIGGSRRMICYDEVEPHEKVKLYNNCSVSDAQPRQGDRQDSGYRREDASVQPIDQVEPLSLLAQHFRDCINGAAVPLCDGRAGLRTIEMLTAVDRSVAEDGRRVPVSV
jgi:predicted dehydrogenase